MLEIIVLIFLTRRIGHLAVKKGLNPTSWKLLTIGAWILAEITGGLFAAALFGSNNLVALFSIGIFSAFGGYLLVKYILEKKPDALDDDIDRIGSDDLRPPQ